MTTSPPLSPKITSSNSNATPLNPVQQTSDDAALSKHSAANLGYLDDAFIQFFVSKPKRRAPIINRGYYSRVAMFDLIVERFLYSHAEHPKKQIVSLGAGNDTTFFRLKSQNKEPTSYIEIDFKQVVERKVKIIGSNKPMHDCLGLEEDWTSCIKNKTIDGEECVEIDSEKYKLKIADLSKIESLEQALNECNIDFTIPTLCITECVLVYIEPELSAIVLRWCADHFTNCLFMSYEQIRPNDPFGKMMIENLKQRGCELKGITSHPDCPAMIERYKTNHWKSIECYDMNFIYSKCLDPHDVHRIEKLEIFDEFEEWHMIQEHYCITLANNSEDLFKSVKLYQPST